MNRSDLFLSLSSKNKSLDQSTIEETCRLILEALTTALHEGNRIEVRGFGSFNLHTRKPRVCRNPKTGVVINLPERQVIRFKPGKKLKEGVR